MSSVILKHLVFIHSGMCLCFGCAGSSLLLHRLSLVAASGGAVFVAVREFLVAVTSLVAEHGL